MKTLLIISALSLFLSGCASLNTRIKEDAPLHETLNEVKKELRAFRSKLKANDHKFTCGADTYSVIDNMEFSEIELTISVVNTINKEGEGGITVASAIEAGRSRSKKSVNTDTLVLKLVPQSIPEDTTAQPSKEGIAENLLSVVEQLAKVDDNGPCLHGGSKSTLTLGFNIEKSSAAEGGLDLVVFSIGGEKTKTKSYTNQIKLTFSFGDIQTLKAPTIR